MSVSHTVGILVLAALVVGAQGVLAPDMVVRTAPVVAAISIVAIGGWMLFGELRRRRRRVASRSSRRRRTRPRPRSRARARAHARARPPSSARARARDHDHAHEPAHSHEPALGEHSHGGVRHSHLPPTGSTITWRSLFVLGLAGGLIPSTSALLILLGSIAAGRPAFGFVLVVAFGVGMAAVMAGIGLAMVFARGRLERVGSGSPLGSVSDLRAARGRRPGLRARALPHGPGRRRRPDALTLAATDPRHLAVQATCGPRQGVVRAGSGHRHAGSTTPGSTVLLI